MHSLSTLAAAAPPAGGAALGQVAGMSAAVTLFTAVLLWLGLGHRSGRVAALGRAAGALGRLSGLPGWAALPLALAGPPRPRPTRRRAAGRIGGVQIASTPRCRRLSP